MYIKANKEGIKKATKKGWRLIHDGVNVMDLAEQDFETLAGGTTEIFEADTKEELDAEVAKLGLVVPERIIEKYKK